ncbi:MAG: type II secretion system F family protein [Pseudomonadales bacterium]
MRVNNLSATHRATLFSALLDLDRKQGGWDKVFQLLSQGQRVARRAHMSELAAQLEEGQTVVLEGLKNTGQFLPWELQILALGLATGTISESYQRLREHYLLQQRFNNELKRQLKWPFLFVIVVLVVLLVWAYSDQQLSLLAVGVRLLLSAVVMVGIATVVGWLVRCFRADTLPAIVSSTIKHFPGVNGLIFPGQTSHYFKNLNQCINSGLPLIESLKLSAQKIPDTFYSPSFMTVHDAVQEGRKLSVALASCGILNGIELKPLAIESPSAMDAQIHIAEAAYHHYIERLWFLTRWIPQLLYAVVPLLALVLLITIR